jgi:predicted nucleic acid-binding protein
MHQPWIGGDVLDRGHAVIAEAAYRINRELGPSVEQTLYTAILDGGLVVETLTSSDWARVREPVGQYRDLPLGGTDASLVAIAERLDLGEVATLDRRHFGVVRSAHVRAFMPLP